MYNELLKTPYYSRSTSMRTFDKRIEPRLRKIRHIQLNVHEHYNISTYIDSEGYKIYISDLHQRQFVSCKTRYF